RRQAEIAPVEFDEVEGAKMHVAATAAQSIELGEAVVVTGDCLAIGGFAEFIPVPARYLVKANRRLKFEELAPLTDAGMTPFRGMKKLRDAGALGPGRVIGVLGIGGLGGHAVQYCACRKLDSAILVMKAAENRP